MSDMEAKELAVRRIQSAFPDLTELQRWARVYASADILPNAWKKGGEESCLAKILVVMSRAQALHCDPLLLLQNIDFIAGRMCWKSTFLLQLLLANGWMAPKYNFIGSPTAPDFWEKPDNGCSFSAVNPTTGERETGSFITVAMVQGEGWLTKDGSKWGTMPEQMFKYRAVSFFCRSNAPAVMGGLYAQDEVEDIVAQEARANAPQPQKEQVKELPEDVQKWLHYQYEMGVKAIEQDSTKVTLSAKGKATDDLVRHLEGLRVEAERDLVKFRQDHMTPPAQRPGWASSPSNPGGSCYHD